MVFIPEDKRRFPRMKVKVPLRCQVRGNPEFSNFVTDNIGLGGLGFIGDSFLAPATNLMLEVNILLHVLTPIGRVAWSVPLPHSDKYQSGVEFIEIDLNHKKYLEDFLEMQALRA